MNKTKSKYIKYIYKWVIINHLRFNVKIKTSVTIFFHKNVELVSHTLFTSVMHIHFINIDVLMINKLWERHLDERWDHSDDSVIEVFHSCVGWWVI